MSSGMIRNKKWRQNQQKESNSEKRKILWLQFSVY
jgi:hypothetical protein